MTIDPTKIDKPFGELDRETKGAMQRSPLAILRGVKTHGPPQTRPPDPL